MAGSRPISDQEALAIIDSLNNKRDKCFVVIGLKTGFRISEILSIKAMDVVQYGFIADSVTVNRANMKGKKTGRTVVLHQEIKKHLEEMGVLQMNPTDRLFPICRMQASRIFSNAVHKCRIEGKVTVHSLRKHFARKMHNLFEKDLIKTQKALGHANINSTVHYLQFEQKEIDDAILRA